MKGDFVISILENIDTRHSIKHRIQSSHSKSYFCKWAWLDSLFTYQIQLVVSDRKSKNKCHSDTSFRSASSRLPPIDSSANQRVGPSGTVTCPSRRFFLPEFPASVGTRHSPVSPRPVPFFSVASTRAVRAAGRHYTGTKKPSIRQVQHSSIVVLSALLLHPAFVDFLHLLLSYTFNLLWSSRLI